MMHDDRPSLTLTRPADDASINDRMWLEVRRGRTRAPRRPVRTRRFLIGAGSNCQLQLGGDDVPILHSILLIDEDGAQIDAVVPAPELYVNGVPQRAATLRDGDVITIGKFEFAVHVQQPADADGAERNLPAEEPDSPFGEEDLSELSAAALVERLESELRRIEQFRCSRETGAAALLQAARRHGGEEGDEAEARAQQAVLLELQQLSAELRRRHESPAAPAVAVVSEPGHRKAS